MYLLLVSTFVAAVAGIVGGGLAGDQAYFGSCNDKNVMLVLLKVNKQNYRLELNRT